MGEKLKAIAEQVKAILAYIITPLAFIAGVIYYLVSKNNKLEDQLAATLAKKQLEEQARVKDKVDREAANAVDDYERIKSEYSKNNGSGSDHT